jgi:hypothetical protein
MTGRHDGIRLTVPNQVHRDQDRGVLLLAQGERRVLVHRDDLRGVDDRDVGRHRPADGPDGRLVADQDQPIVGMAPGVIKGARDDLRNTMIAAHRVDRDTDAA